MTYRVYSGPPGTETVPPMVHEAGKSLPRFGILKKSTERQRDEQRLNRVEVRQPAEALPRVSPSRDAHHKPGTGP